MEIIERANAANPAIAAKAAIAVKAAIAANAANAANAAIAAKAANAANAANEAAMDDAMASSDVHADDKVSFSPNQLFTITTEGVVDNVTFRKEREMVPHFLANIPGTFESLEWRLGGDEKTDLDILMIFTSKGVFRLPDVDKEEHPEVEARWMSTLRFAESVPTWNESIIRVGCNYGEYLSKEYYELVNPVKKTNRGRKRKVKRKTTKNGTGLRCYFNSQITFTVVVNHVEGAPVAPLAKTDHLYHIKLYTNGKIQIPNVKDENIEVVIPCVGRMTRFIDQFSMLKKEQDAPCVFGSIRSIMRNYKFTIEQPNILIDVNKIIPIFSQCREYFVNGTPCEYAAVFEENREVLTAFEMALCKYFNEKYVGFIVKFITPTEEFPNRSTTVMIFYSGKFNIDGGNCPKQAIQVRNILTTLVQISKQATLYKRLE